ncbi:hypothetical protein BDR22DRAFT_671171 [Usnea florida]
MTPLNIKTPKAPETQEDSVVPDASNYHQRLPQIGEGSDLSYLPNASEVDDNTELPEDRSSFVSAENEDTADLPYYSDPGDSEYHESDISTSTFKYKNNKAEAEGAALPAAEDPEVGEVSTPGDRPVIDDYSNLSDAFDANDGSGNFDARPLVSTPTRQQLSSFSNAIHSIDRSTSSDIKMGSVAETSAVVSAPESAVESSIVGSSTVGSSGDVTVTPSEDVKPSKNLPILTEMALLTTFFHDDRQSLFSPGRWHCLGSSYRACCRTTSPSRHLCAVPAIWVSKPTVRTAVRRHCGQEPR